MASESLSFDGSLRWFVESVPRDEGEEAFVGDFLRERVSLSELLTVAAEREAEGQLNSLARTVTTRVLSTKAGSSALDRNDGGALDMLVGGLSRRAKPAVRAEASKAVGKAAFSSGWATKVAEALGVAIVDDDVSVSDAACEAAATLTSKSSSGAGRAALEHAKTAAKSSPTKLLRYCDAAVRASLRKKGGLDVDVASDVVALAVQKRDPLLQLNALELVSKLGASDAGARAILRHVDALMALAAAKEEDDDMFKVGDHAVPALGSALATAAKSFSSADFSKESGCSWFVEDESLRRFLGLALGKLKDLNVSALEAIGAIASTARGLRLVLEDDALATQWLTLRADARTPSADVDVVQRHRLASFATALAGQKGDDAANGLWRRLAALEELLPLATTSPRDPKIQIAAVHLLTVATNAAPSAAPDLASEAGFYEWLVRDDDDPRTTSDQLRTKFHLLEAIYDKKAFNVTTQGQLAYLIQLGPFRPRKTQNPAPKVKVAERAA